MALFEIDQDLKAAELTLNYWAKKYPEIARAEMSANVEYELAYEDAYDRISQMPPPEGQKPPTVDAIKAKARLACEKQLRAYRAAKSELSIANKLIGIAETTLTSIQTRTSLEKMEVGMSAYRT